MEDKYKICEVQICTFTFEKYGIRPNLNKYPIARLCVIDTKNKIAIDVGHECKYDFLESTSMLSFMNGASEKIKEDKRAAFSPIVFLGFENEKYERKTKEIIIKLENGYEFLDGNDLYSNEEYLKLVTKESEERLKKRTKPTKQKIFRRKK